MKAIYNNELIDSGQVSLKLNDRALSYGDGIFETIYLNNKPSPLLTYHLKRLYEGAQILHFELPEYLDETFILDTTKRLIKINNLSTPIKVKIQIWRKEGGFYKPLNNETNILINVSKPSMKKQELTNVGFTDTIYKNENYYSHLKTLNSLPYILAAIEMKQRNLDDIILTNKKGYLIELLFSNLFWIKEKTIYTPALNSGCIKGVMRSYLIDQFKKKQILIREVLAKKDILLNADYVFASNAIGLAPVQQIESVKFKIYPGLNNLNPHTAT